MREGITYLTANRPTVQKRKEPQPQPADVLTGEELAALRREQQSAACAEVFTAPEGVTWTPGQASGARPSGASCGRACPTRSARAEQRELAQFLTPVQRAQFVLAFARLEGQIEQVIRRRMEGAGQPGRIRNP